MRTIPAALQAILSSESSTLCYLVSIGRKTKGNVFLTNTDNNVVFDSQTYVATGGFTISDIVLSSASLVQNLELIVSEESNRVNRDDIVAGEYANEAVTVTLVDWADTGADGVVLFAGKITDISFGTDGFIVLNVEGGMTEAKLLANETYSPLCRNALGDSICSFNINSTRFLFTVGSSPTDYNFRTDATAADDYFTDGIVEWVTGDNANLYSDVRKYVNTNGRVKLWTKTPHPIQVGDTGYLYQGCPKTVAACRDTFDNLINFRGEPFLPNEEVSPPKPRPKADPDRRRRPCKLPDFDMIVR